MSRKPWDVDEEKVGSWNISPPREVAHELFWPVNSGQRQTSYDDDGDDDTIKDGSLGIMHAGCQYKNQVKPAKLCYWLPGPSYVNEQRRGEKVRRARACYRKRQAL